MKDCLSGETVASDPKAPLDIAGEHKVNVLYSGTTPAHAAVGGPGSDGGKSAPNPGRRLPVLRAPDRIQLDAG